MKTNEIIQTTPVATTSSCSTKFNNKIASNIESTISEINKRTIYINGTIGPDTVNSVVKTIGEISLEDDMMEENYKSYERQPIKLIINSYGGSVYSGLALITAMMKSKTPIHTECMGVAMSMAFVIFICGTKRIGSIYSTFMYHEISTIVWDKVEGIKQEIAECERLQKLGDDTIINRTNITEEQLKDIKERKKEWYISGAEALDLGVVDELI